LLIFLKGDFLRISLLLATVSKLDLNLTKHMNRIEMSLKDVLHPPFLPTFTLIQPDVNVSIVIGY